MPEKKHRIPSRDQRIGRGVESNVYLDPTNDTKIIKESSREILRAKRGVEFYATKIAHLLFPENVPRMYAIHLGSPGNADQKVVGRVDTSTDVEHRAIQEYMLDPTRSAAREALKKSFDIVEARPEVEKLKEQLNTSGFMIDSTGTNFARTPNGTIVYVDNVSVPLNDIETLTQTIAAIDDQQIKKQAEKYLHRLLEHYDAIKST